MYHKWEMKRLSDEEIENCLGYQREELSLNKRRLDALLGRQAREPNWSYFDRFIEEEVSIDIMVEAFISVGGEIERAVKQLEDTQWERRGLNQTLKMF